MEVSSPSINDLAGYACLSTSACGENWGSNKSHVYNVQTEPGTTGKSWKVNLCSRVSGMVDEFSNLGLSFFLFLFFSETEFHSAAVADLALPVEIKLDFH